MDCSENSPKGEPSWPAASANAIGMGAIRFSLGRYTAIEEIDAVVDRLTDVLAAGSRLNAKPPGLVEGTDRRSL